MYGTHQCPYCREIIDVEEEEELLSDSSSSNDFEFLSTVARRPVPRFTLGGGGEEVRRSLRLRAHAISEERNEIVEEFQEVVAVRRSSSARRDRKLRKHLCRRIGLMVGVVIFVMILCYAGV